MLNNSSYADRKTEIEDAISYNEQEVKYYERDIRDLNAKLGKMIIEKEFKK